MPPTRTDDDLPTGLDHIELGEQLLTRATNVYENARRTDLLAVTTGRPHEIERRNVLLAEAGTLAQLATAHFAAAQCLAGHDDTQPIGLVPVGDFNAGDLTVVDYGPHLYGLGTIESQAMHEEGDDRG